MRGVIGEINGCCIVWKVVGGVIIVLMILRVFVIFGGKFELVSRFEIMLWVFFSVV